ncbi:Hypothetical protein BIBO2_1337 [Brucella sp. BO2]|nr:Hypothetical protein BIBO2_1337 [Brucella sp. BO2]KEY05514.1 hypothetical protein IL59_0202840 [Brucella suis bv. 4 str. 40]
MAVSVLEIEGMRAAPAMMPAVPCETDATLTRSTRFLLRSALLLRGLWMESILQPSKDRIFYLSMRFDSKRSWQFYIILKTTARIREFRSSCKCEESALKGEEPVEAHQRSS